jgi:hypothetical protein
MKRTLPLLFIFIFALFSTIQLSAQCTPDPSCEDIDEPGQYCPEVFPPVVLDEAYDQVMTFILPATEYDVLGTIYNLDSIAVDSVKNIPPGMTHSSNSTGYVAGKAYCTQLTGTPTESGTFPVEIYLRAFATPEGGSQVELGPYLDDTSVVITVNAPSAIQPQQLDEFQVLPVAPNPFSEFTQLSFYTPYDDRIKLQVYNILGELMHEEAQGASPGEHRFEFNGNGLLPGTYFYRVSNSKRLFTGKFIKSK